MELYWMILKYIHKRKVQIIERNLQKKSRALSTRYIMKLWLLRHTKCGISASLNEFIVQQVKCPKPSPYTDRILAYG